MSKKKRPPPKDTRNKEDKAYENISKTIQQFMGGKRYEPMGQIALFKRLKIPSSYYPLCKKIMTDLEEKGFVRIEKKQYLLNVRGPEVITGTLRMHPRGFGFVIPDHPAECPQDVFIPKHLTNDAVDGDKVQITVQPSSLSDKGPEGAIVAVVKRGRTHLAGTVKQFDSENNATIHVPLLGATRLVIVLAQKEIPLVIGDRLILKVIEWGGQNSHTLCEVSHKLGNISDPSCDINAAVEEFDIKSTFSKLALNEAKALGSKVTAKDQKNREDLTGHVTFTIDPATARDFDDALSLTKDRQGNFHLGVHIADVAHYVKRDSFLDHEAIERCNSTYFPGTCIPMLPEELSNNLCSLREKVIRLTVSVLMEFDKDGTLKKTQVVRSFIKSRKRFTYEEAKEVIDGKKKSVYASSLKNMVDLCLLLKKKRYERGSIDFALPEVVLEVDEKGAPYNFRIVEYDISHQLVEEFMLKANEVVAKHLYDRGKPVLYRIHEEPSPESFQDFFALARTLGFALPQKPTLQDIQALFEKAKKTPFGQQLSVGFIRSMKLAYYSPENVGHYGLALEYYCHFTSPIRRYTDLVIQRLLFNEEGEELNLEKTALLCSEKERISFRAEMSVKTLKKLRLIKHFYEEDPGREFPAVVTKIKPFGLFFELNNILLEGFLHVSELEDDYFVYDQQGNTFTGKSTGIKHVLGENIKVRLVSVDFILLESKWELATSKKRKPHSFPKRRRWP